MIPFPERDGILACVLECTSLDSISTFRTVSASFRRALIGKLAANPRFSLAFDHHVDRLKKLKLRRPWVGIRMKPGLAVHSFRIDGRVISVDADRFTVSHSESRPQHQGAGRDCARFFYDRVFDQSATQANVWSDLESPLLDCVREHRHACVLAYGQTGSGKTHTMFGNRSEGGQGVAFRTIHKIASMLRSKTIVRVPPLICLTCEGGTCVGCSLSGEELVRFEMLTSIARNLRERLARALNVDSESLTVFEGSKRLKDDDLISEAFENNITVQYGSPHKTLHKPLVEFSFLEIYNEHIFDLLQGGAMLPQIRESSDSVVPQGTTKLSCCLENMESTFSEWLRAGACARTIGETVFNPQSSRSHAVATIYINWNPDCERRVYLVDLAGSERIGKYAMSDEQLREGNNINHSLSTLARVVSAVAAGKGQHVPLRDSALTWLLSDAIVGELAKSFLLAAANPASEAETFATLKYANQFSTLHARGGVKVARIGKDIRLMEVKLACLREDFHERCKRCQMPRAWTSECLRRGGVRAKKDSKQVMLGHLGLEWTEAHNSISEEDVGYVKGVFGEANNVVEVVYEGRGRKQAVTLPYPVDCLERVNPPRFLAPIVDVVMQMSRVEEQLTRAREAMSTERDNCAKELHRLMSRR